MFVTRERTMVLKPFIPDSENTSWYYKAKKYQAENGKYVRRNLIFL
jgi:hypothetical protein